MTGVQTCALPISGLLIASGLITGEALMGIAIAILAAAKLNLSLSENYLTASWVGLILLGLILFYLYRTVSGISRKDS